MEDSEVTSNNMNNNYHDKADDAINETDPQVRSKCSSFCAKINVTIEPVVCAFFLSINLCDAVITNLYMSRVCEVEMHLNKSECSLLGSDTDEGHRVEAMVQPYATFLLTGKSLLVSIVPAILSLFLGPWSDYNGRKLLLLSPLLGSAMSHFVYVGFLFLPNLSPNYLLLATLPFSFCGGFINFISAAYSYISDVSTEENRALRLGLLETSLFVGVLMGITSSYKVFTLDRHYGYTITLCISASVSLLAFVYGILFVPESVRRTENVAGVKEPFQLKFLKEIFATSFKRRENHGRALICMSLVVMTTTIVAMEGESNLFYLFTRLRFGWDLQQFTKWASISIGAKFFGLLFGCIILTKVLKLPDIILVITAYLMMCLETIFICFIPRNSSYLMYWSQVVGLLGGIAGPAIRSVVSKVVPKEDVGKVFFLATSCESLLPLAFTPIYTAIYDTTMNYLPGAFFLLSASFYVLDLILCGCIHFIQRRNASYARLDEHD